MGLLNLIKTVSAAGFSATSIGASIVYNIATTGISFAYKGFETTKHVIQTTVEGIAYISEHLFNSKDNSSYESLDPYQQVKENFSKLGIKPLDDSNYDDNIDLMGLL